MASRKTTTKAAAAKTPAAAKTQRANAPAKPVAAKAAQTKPAAKKPAVAKPLQELAAPLFDVAPALKAVESMAPLTAEAMKPVEAAVANGTETLEAVVKAGTQAATKGYEQAVAMTQEQVAKASSTVFEGYDEVTSLSQGHMDACVQSSTVVAKGVEALGQEMVLFTQGTMKAGMLMVQALAGAKTLREMIDVQTEYSRSSFDSMLAESAKLTELSVALASEAIEPLQAQMTQTAEKMMKPLAA
ncbi:phasin family protein [Pelagibius litoralis]|uniref:Phasin family protein n=1 Tax=Pelagibius litoralis TaxID=374515 RepID=A0A967KIJ2_9PROT|nr:phasin family protein [Pelagibius litoralis]NIA72346.1 phasin family protein [Pelagibius litoralis]